MLLTPANRRVASRLATGLVAASLLVGVLGVTSASAASTYATDTPMILHNVSPEDLLANTRGICDGQFDIVVRNVLGATNSLRYLDAAQRCGLKAVLFFQSTTSGGTVYPSRVPALVNAVKNHPALYGYLSVKEPSWVGINRYEIRALYGAFHKADPAHPVVALFGDIPHFGDSANPYTRGMADIVMVDWYPVETGRGGCSSTGSTYVTYGPKWYSTKVRPRVQAATPGVPVWVMVQTHKNLGPSCHKKQRPSWSLMLRQVREAFTYAGADGIAFHTWSNVNYKSDQRRDAQMVYWMKTISNLVSAGTFQ
jgi:hypothetical protein